MKENTDINIVYILGNSYSGSTLISFLIGAHPSIECLGEPKFFNRSKKANCTCGQNIDACEFWSKIPLESYNIFDQPSSGIKFTIVLNSLLGIKSRPLRDKSDDTEFLNLVMREKKKINVNVDYLIDASKSVWRLHYLMNLENITVYPIYIKRNAKGSIASYLKRGRTSFIKAVTIYFFKNFIAKRYLKINKIPHIEILHSNLCKGPQEQMNRIGNFLNKDFKPLDNLLKQKIFHVFTGNGKTTQQFEDGFKKIEEDRSWEKILNKKQIGLLDFLSKASLN